MKIFTIFVAECGHHRCARALFAPPAQLSKGKGIASPAFFRLMPLAGYSAGGLVMERFSCTTLRTNIRPASVHTVVRNNPVRPSLRW